MTAPELDKAMAIIGWREGTLADRISRSRSFVGQIRRGERPVPERVARYVSAVAKAVASVPGCDEMEG